MKILLQAALVSAAFATRHYGAPACATDEKGERLAGGRRADVPGARAG